MLNQKGLTTIIVVLIIAATIGGYLLYSGKITLQSKTITSQTTVDETANWKTYTNTDLGFSFKYPNDWKFETKSYDGGGGNYIRFSQDNTEQLQLEIKTDQSFDQLKNQLKLTTPETTVGGRRALKYETGMYILLDSTKVLSLQRIVYPDEKSYLDYILSTFKFLDQNSVDTSAWKTYKDWYSGRFSFKYPEGWSLHTEGGNIDSGKSMRESLKNFPNESYSDEYVMINGIEVLIRDVIDAGPAYGRVIEAYIPYEKNGYIWLTGRKIGLENRKATEVEIKEFVNIVSTLNIKPQN